MPPVERASGSLAASNVPPAQPASPHCAEPNKPLAGDSISSSSKIKERIHLAGSISMIAMTPLMLGMMAMPLLTSSKKSNTSGGTGSTGGMTM